MRRVLRNGAVVFLAVGIAGWGVAGCASSQATRSSAAKESPAGVSRHPSPRGSGTMLSLNLLDHANLRSVWELTLPLKKGEKFVAITLLGDRLYLRSDQNYLWSLDRAKGEVVFSRSIAPPGIPVLGLTLYGNSLLSVIGNKFVELDLGSGKEQRVSDLELSIVTPPVRNSEFLYVGAADRRLHVFRVKDLVRIFPVTADDDSLVTTVVADDSLVAFGTDAGDLVGMAPDAPKRLWSFKAPEAVAGPVIRDGNSFYFASADTNVYRVDATEGSGAVLTWKYQTEAILDRSPAVTKDFVYQYAVGRGLTAIAKQTGKAAWSLPEGIDLLAEAGTRAYVITRDRTLAVMDNAAGQKLFAVNFAPVTDHAANTMDARIYLTDDTGRVTCLEPMP
ncbi:MAG: PQQ-binding-like beta-propeller repeat protein [Planctomycetes bacterium]|nr:PQQ-binding-like beta-propeller repeat protein [Planctomycetota bacterium]